MDIWLTVVFACAGFLLGRLLPRRWRHHERFYIVIVVAVMIAAIAAWRGWL